MSSHKEAAHSICNLRFKMPKEIPVVFHNGADYNSHYIIKELREEFAGQFECLGENIGKYITFSLPIKNEKKKKNGKTIACKIKFITLPGMIILLKDSRKVTAKITSLILNI